MANLYLASRSPRRFELLRQLGIEPEVIHIECDESVHSGEQAGDYVLRVSRDKALAGWESVKHIPQNYPVLAADTAVIVDGQILGKPRDFEHACEMWTLLSENSHEVLSAVVVRHGQLEQTVVQRSIVSMRQISSDEMLAYWQTGEPQDKAGAYAIQGLAAAFVTEIRGSYSGIMGLPLYETAQILKGFGLIVLSNDVMPEKKSKQ